MLDLLTKLDENLVIALVILGSISFFLGYKRGNRRRKKDENLGEGAVRRLLVRYCQNSTSHVLNNITLPYGDGTTQIDHILITQNGILVIETKHYSGWLFANETQKKWTQVKFHIKRQFQNPIFQNKKHVLAVQKLLDFLPSEEIKSLVVFTGDAEFKTEIPKGVIHIDELMPYIDGMRFASISENRVHFCVGRIECKRFELTSKTDIEHQAYLESKFGET
ncbi:nuclease-related domain-containing protein [Gynuella sp.]|uniref:nuclease-related domain-containing protein n=1 Tax=Gynuella sp. TaxID=2969146 RepID=UPI003D0B6931